MQINQFPKPNYNFSKNPLDSLKIELGRKLFYDPILSQNNSTSCASCHSPYAAFAHNDHDLSHGIYDSIGPRNAPALFNLAWHKFFMWDGAINHLNPQPLAPIHSQTEMGSSIKEVLGKLRKDSIYTFNFKKAFGDTQITSDRFLKSLAQFQLTLVSNNSKYDSVKRKKSEFTLQEKNGYSSVKIDGTKKIILKIKHGATTEEKAIVMREWYRKQLKLQIKPLKDKWEKIIDVSAKYFAFVILRPL